MIQSPYWDALSDEERAKLSNIFEKERQEVNDLVINLLQRYRPSLLDHQQEVRERQRHRLTSTTEMEESTSTEVQRLPRMQASPSPSSSSFSTHVTVATPSPSQSRSGKKKKRDRNTSETGKLAKLYKVRRGTGSDQIHRSTELRKRVNTPTLSRVLSRDPNEFSKPKESGAATMSEAGKHSVSLPVLHTNKSGAAKRNKQRKVRRLPIILCHISTFKKTLLITLMMHRNFCI